jgi:voltage-gated potassium channel
MIKEFKNIIITILFLFIGGSVGYSLIEKWDFFDSLYMTIITVSTTGFQEIYPMSIPGRIFTMFLIIMGISFLFYALGNLNVAIFERNIFRNKKMQNRISKLDGHYIICGFGKIGKKVAQELKSRKKDFVILEINELHLKDIPENYLYLHADATEDQNLIRSGIEQAAGLVAVMGSDASNVFTTLSAKGLSPGIKIIAQAEEENSREKLIKAGAERAILPYEIGGYRIIQALLRPTVVEYMDEIFSRSDIGLEFEEIKIAEKASIIDKTLADLSLRSELNVIIIGIYRSGTKWIYNPRSDTKLHAGDILIVIGETNDLAKMEKQAGNE